MSKNKKLKITEIIVDLLPNSSTFKTIPLEKTLFRWWTTGRSGNNLRLTDEGKQAFDLAEIEYYDYPLFTERELESMDKVPIKGKMFTVGLKKIDCPFYIGFRTRFRHSGYVRVYDSKIAMMIALYGSFKEYLENKK